MIERLRVQILSHPALDRNGVQVMPGLIPVLNPIHSQKERKYRLPYLKDYKNSFINLLENLATLQLLLQLN